MAQSSSSQTTNPSTETSTDACSIPAALKFVISNIKNIVNTQLSSENYSIWRSQVTKLLKANGFYNFIDPDFIPPDRFQQTNDGSSVINPKHTEWVLIDQNLAAALCSTISTAILPYVLHLESTAEIWNTIERRLQASNRSRVIQLKNELHNVSMKQQTMAEYLNEVKTLVDKIAAAGAKIDKEDVILYTLNGLPSAYQSFKGTIRTLIHPISLDDLYAFLISEEININTEAAKQLQHQDQNTALYTNRGRGRRGRGRNNYQNTRSNNQPLQQCQICNKKGHSANNCWHRYNNNYVPPPPKNNTALNVTNDNQNPDWYLDSGATAHLTNDISNLTLGDAIPYNGDDNIQIGDGSTIPIAHKGSGLLPTPTRKLILSQLLHIPQISHKLLSIYHLTKDNKIAITFDEFGFLIKDTKTNQTLLQGPSRKGLYPIPTTSHKLKPTLIAIHQSSTTWHNRLGHPNIRTMTMISNQNHTLQIPKPIDNCTACKMAKSHRLQFPVSNSRSHVLLELLHSDVWGPAPITSYQGYKYYLLLLDDYSRFTWVFPIKSKCEVADTFIMFHTMIEKQFPYKVKQLRSDGGSEYINKTLQNYLQKHGIVHQISCPYTPEQNGTAERKHRHLIETTRTLINTASIPYKYWPDTVLTASYLINRMPSQNTKNKSPYQLLYNKTPDYSILRAYGCECFPWIPPQNRHKLAPRATSCIFLGYSPSYKGYKCLHPTNNKITISRHVTFHENVFPFTQISQTHHITAPHTIPNNPYLLTPATQPTYTPQNIPITQTTNTSQTIITPPRISQNAQTTSQSSQPTDQHTLSIPQLSNSTTQTCIPPSTHTHPMITRLQTGSLKPKTIFNLLHQHSPNQDPITYK
ncbi:Retrovirus-related Pol polyprotein from transposon TNT 1-94 [Dendrobium catenatum]|uniref:Retrovirus-related Pol polyprotein from transposon TNT 1-94 n=1 Tax=Dendrobium catenatum TaxID=906689 RepID=A0A2I0W5M0_9ASPA|nr:Retrovirus-related Pol polyprotein from transposon TNT 1-94 [Dendrobium catenatum]